MPISFKYDKEKDLLYTTIDGKVTLDDFKNALNQALENTEFPVDTNTLVDFRGCDFNNITADTFRQLILMQKQKAIQSKVKIAYIADKDFKFGMVRMYEILSSDLPLNKRVFKEFSEGERWLLEDKNESADK